MFILILTHFIFKVRVYIFQVCLLACCGGQKNYAEKWLGDSKPEGAYVTESKENAISLFHDAIQWTT